MEVINAKCCVCLMNLTKDAQKITNYDNKNEQWINKLQYVVPEVEWLEDYKLCNSCTVSLDAAYKFRNFCIQCDNDRKKVLIVKSQEKPIIFTCFHCNEGFNSKDTLATHIEECHLGKIKRTEENNEKFPCKNCNKIYSTRKILRTHQKSCTIEKKKPARVKKRSKFSCEICNLELKYAKAIIEHCIEEHSMDKKNIKPYSCDECSMRFSSSTNLIQHKKYHDGNRSHICSFCGKSYITKSDLTVHEYTHFNRRNYKCDVCEKAFNTNKNLCSHKLVVHTDSSLWKYCCDLCKKRFPLKSGYDQHVRRHTGDKRFICLICGKPFISRSELQKHMGFHSKAKPFKCSHCDKSYKERRVYEIHLTKTHGIGNAKIPVRIKKHVCHICPNNFADRQKLERHLRTHSGIKPFECGNCDRKFNDKYYLKQHMKNVHGVDVEEV